MSIFDKLTERVGDFFDEVLLPEPVRRAHDAATRHMTAQNYTLALQALRPSLIEHPNVARTHHLIGMCHFHRTEWGDAIAAFERALAIKEVATTHFYAGLAAEQVGRWKDVQRHFARALGLTDALPFAFDLHFGLGRAYRELGRTDKAIKELRGAIKTWPAQLDASLTLAQILLDAGRTDEAEAVMAVLEPSEQPEFLFVRAQLHERAGDLETAMDTYSRAASTASKFKARAAIGAARIALSRGLHDEAESFVAALDTPTELAVELWALQGRIAEQRGELDVAQTFYERAVADDSRHADALLGLGRLALGRGDRDEAASRFVRVFASSDATHRQEAWLGAGRCHLQAGDLAGARHLFEQALDLGGPRSGEVSWALGHTALELGDAAEAMVYLQDALDLVPDALRDDVQATLDTALERLAPRWDLPDALGDPEQVMEVLSALLQYLGTDSRLSDFLPATQRLHAAMNSPLSLAIVGEFNAGKSTIVNTLLGEDVFPTGVLPTTAHTGILRWGPRKAARVIYLDGRRVEQSLEAAKKTMKTDADSIERLEFTHPHADLRLVQYWDTPGFNALVERHETVAVEALETAEAILWVMDANQVLSQTELDRIESLPDGAERLLVVINKIDRLGAPDDREDEVEDLLEYVTSHLDGYIAGAFAISARDATASDDQLVSASGFAGFRTFLEERVIQRAGRIKTIEVSRQLGHLAFTLQAFQNGLVHRYGDLARNVADLEIWLGKTASTIPRERAAEEVVLITQWINSTLEGIEAEIEDSLRPTSSWTGKRALGDDDRQFVLDLVLERLDRILESSQQRMVQVISETEREIAERLDPVVRALSVGDARALQRRIEGFFDESRVVSMLWQERVYGAFAERARGRVETTGRAVLATIEAAQSERTSWRPTLRRLLPSMDEEFGHRIERWYAAFFEASLRLCSRIRKDLELLELEARTRYNVAPVLALTPMATVAHEEPEQPGDE